MAQPELNRLIIQNLGDLDAAAKVITNELERAIFDTLSELFVNFMDRRDWVGETKITPIWLAPEDWRQQESNGSNKFRCRFEMGISDPEAGDADHFELTSLIGAGYQREGLRWTRSFRSKRAWKIFVSTQQDILRRLRSRGFAYEEEYGSFFLPVKIDQDTVAQAVFDETPALALAPYDDALQVCADAKFDFDALLAAEGSTD